MTATTAHTVSRRFGVVVFGLALLTAVAIAGLQSKTLSGTPKIAPPPGPPGVGNCVTDPIDPSWEQPTEVYAASGATVTYSYPQVGIGPCRGNRYGEITALIVNPSKVVVSDKAPDGSVGPNVQDANITTCRQAADRYVGIAAAATGWTVMTGGWSPNQSVQTAASTPSSRQLAAGQHWLAWIVYLGADIGNPEPLADQERYNQPLRAALSTGANSNRIGTCTAAASLNDAPAACGTAHQSEIFTSSGAQPRVLSRAGLQQSCAQVVRQATGIPDVTAAGLAVKVLATAADGEPVTAPQIPAGAFLTCGVTANHGRRLAGSLLALGQQPVPWA